jgi:hypothetical protein
MAKRTVSKRIVIEQTGHTVAICGVDGFDRDRLVGFSPNKYDKFFVGRDGDGDGRIIFFLARTLSEHRREAFEMYHVWYRSGTAFRGFGYDMSDAVKKAAAFGFIHA